jgi:hypothetical protein
MSKIRWGARDSTGLGPGVVRLYDANFIMLQALPFPDKDRQLVQRMTRNLHQSTTQGLPAFRQAIADYQKALPALKQSLHNKTFSDSELKAVLANLIQAGVDGEFRDYAAAEQAVMAIASLLSTLDIHSAFSAKAQQAAGKRLDELYTCVDDDEKYNPVCFTDGLKHLKSAVID